MLNPQNQLPQQIFRPKRSSVSYSILPTLNQVMFQLKKQTPVFALQKQLLQNQINKKNQYHSYLLSPKSATNLHNEFSFQNKSSLVNRILFEKTNQSKQQKNQIKKQPKISLKKQIHSRQFSSKLFGEAIFLNEKQKHERVQSAQKMPQRTYLRIDHKRIQEQNKYLKKEIENIKHKLIFFEEQLRQQAAIIEQKQEIIRKMSSFNDQLCLKLIDFQGQQQIRKSKKNVQSFQQLGSRILSLRKNDELSSPKTIISSLLESDRFIQEEFSNQMNKYKGGNSQKKNKLRSLQSQNFQKVKLQQIETLSQRTKHSSKLPNIEQIFNSKKTKKSNLCDMTHMLKESMNNFWQFYLEDDKKQLSGI